MVIFNSYFDITRGYHPGKFGHSSHVTSTRVGGFFQRRAVDQDLQARASDEDENAFVHDAAKQSLNRRWHGMI